MNKAKNILISGVGQLGRRYLEGILKIQFKIDIYLYDVSSQSLDSASNQIIISGYNQDLFKIYFLNNLDKLPAKIDLSIVSTTANARLEIVKLINQNTKVDYWILEKNISQNVEQLYSIEKIVSCSINTWINTPRRIMELYRGIKTHSIKINVEPFIATMTGGLWGMACNAVHFIDLISFLSESKLYEVDTSGLDNYWHESKRSGFWEVTGKLICYFENKSILKLESNINNSQHFEIKGNNISWDINEVAGIANRNDEFKINHNLLLQSEITPIIVSSILQNGSCELPTFEDTFYYHEIFIHSMLNHWNRSLKNDALFVPIT